MEDREMIERADKVVNLLKLDELCDQLKEFKDADFRAGYFAALRDYPFAARAASPQADGGWDVRPSDAPPKLSERAAASAGRVGGHEEKVEKSPWLIKFNDCECMWDERSYTIDLCKTHAYLANESLRIPID